VAQFDIYRNPMPKSSRRAPYLLEIQSNFVDSVTTCVIIPLVLADSFLPVKVLNPTITVLDEPYLLSTAEITSTLRSNLGRPVASAAPFRNDIIAAIDRLLV